MSVVAGVMLPLQLAAVEVLLPGAGPAPPLEEQ
jgi:hypothetical protein